MVKLASNAQFIDNESATTPQGSTPDGSEEIFMIQGGTRVRNDLNSLSSLFTSGSPIGPFFVTKTVTRNELATLNSSPVSILPALGAGFTIVPQYQFSYYSPGLSVFGSNPTAFVQSSSSYSFGPAIALNQIFGANEYWTANVATFASSVDGDNHALILFDNSDLGIWGPVTGLSVNGSGTGYAPNDTGFLPSDQGNATYKILTVDGSGVPLTTQLLTGGHSFTTGTGQTGTNGGSQPGSGTGLTLDVTVSTAETGTLKILISYIIVPNFS